ncbi:lycopene cyclase family protein [Flavobacterium sp. TSSA_36]|uniref:lycopene cyclase family protein n=1 Tax=Flavobacterium sp. TSSA_36 TaxID=3447669 RepID=UPI003F33F4A0
MSENATPQYDYIFTGVGLAALMTVYKMVQLPFFAQKKILLVDENSKTTNDRTWCFWSTKPSLWEPSVSKHWDVATFACLDYRRELQLYPYRYQMIRGLDFYNQVLNELRRHNNVSFAQEKVMDIEETEQQIFVKTTFNVYYGKRLFNSIYNPNVVVNQQKYPVLQQHFVGWFVQTKEKVFTAEKPTFMDFSVAQKGNTRFMYVLPTSATEALVEYTLFSASLLPKDEYETAIKDYLQQLGVTSYTIQEKEQGSIPMTCYPFWKANTKNVLNIGTAGGWTKASTGYTFRNSDKKSDALVAFLQQEASFTKFIKKTKFWWYDLLLLDILDRTNEMGSTIFSKLFEKGNPTLIFKFLDDETTFVEDLKVIWKCPKLPFIKALFRVVFRFR